MTGGCGHGSLLFGGGCVVSPVVLPLPLPSWCCILPLHRATVCAVATRRVAVAYVGVAFYCVSTLYSESLRGCTDPHSDSHVVTLCTVCSDLPTPFALAWRTVSLPEAILSVATWHNLRTGAWIATVLGGASMRAARVPQGGRRPPRGTRSSASLLGWA